MKKYPSYKDSMVEWIGEIPSSWDTTTLKYQTSFINGMAFKPEEWSSQGIPIVRIANLNGDSEYNFYEGEVDKKYHLHQSDLLFAWSGNIGTSFGPYIWDKVELHYLNQHIFKLSNYSFNKQYFYWLLLAVTSFVESQTHGIIGLVHITKQELGNIRIPKISIEEQKSIADFLDKKILQIDKLIKKKQYQINLLQELLVVLVNDIVTKGLKTDIPLKDSKISSIGHIPAHWDIQRNKRIFIEVNEKSSTNNGELLTVSHLTGITPRSEKSVNMFLAESLEGYKKCAINDLVINTMWAWMGALGISSYNGLVSPSYNIYRLVIDCFPSYLDYLYRTPAFITEINRYSKGIWASRLRLYPESFFQMYTILPPMQEQIEIATFLDSKKDKIEKLIQKFNNQIKLLQEYRITLITNVITGKIDVTEQE